MDWTHFRLVRRASASCISFGSPRTISLCAGSAVNSNVGTLADRISRSYSSASRDKIRTLGIVSHYTDLFFILPKDKVPCNVARHFCQTNLYVLSLAPAYQADQEKQD